MRFKTQFNRLSSLLMALFLCASVSLVFADDANDESTTVEETTGNGTSSDENSSDDNTTTSTTEIPAVQGEVEFWKINGTPEKFGTATVDANGNVTLLVSNATTGYTYGKYLNMRYTVEGVTYYISAASSDAAAITAEGVAYQVNANAQAQGTSLTFNFGSSNTACFKFVINVANKTISCSEVMPLTNATDLTINSGSNIMNALKATKDEAGNFNFAVANTGQADTKSFNLSFDYNDKTYYVGPTISTYASVTSTPQSCSATASNSNNFTFSMEHYKIYDLTVNGNDETISVKDKTDAVTGDLTIASDNIGSGKEITVSSETVSAVDGVYTYDLYVSKGDRYYIYFKYNDGKYCIKAATNSRTVSTGTPMNYACYTKVDIGYSRTFEYTYETGKKYQVTVDTNTGNVTINPVDFKITGDLTMVNANDTSDTRVATESDGQYVFSNVSYDDTNMKYFYFTYEDCGHTFYVAAVDSDHKNFTNGKNNYAIEASKPSNRSLCSSFNPAKDVVLDLNGNISIVEHKEPVLPSGLTDFKCVNLSKNESKNMTFDEEGTTYSVTMEFSGETTYYYFSYVYDNETYYIHKPETASQVRRKEGEEQSSSSSSSDAKSIAFAIGTTQPTLDNGLAFSTSIYGKDTFVFDATSTTSTMSSTENLTSSGVATVEAEASDVAPVYYNLQGMRVDNPEHGIYIRCRGNKVDKVAL